MRYYVTLATRALGYVTYDVDGATEEDAKTRAALSYLKKRRRFAESDFTFAKIVEAGASPPRKRRRRRQPLSADPLRARGSDAANAP